MLNAIQSMVNYQLFDYRFALPFCMSDAYCRSLLLEDSALERVATRPDAWFVLYTCEMQGSVAEKPRDALLFVLLS